ncbi:MAG TPA: urease accessory protein UreE [Polyangia bacterium]|jgi:urease accessory protein|nr:urease accessory protein UreE [Polyangia bacterium]
MLHLTELLTAGTPTGTATLTLDERRRSRLRLTLDDGREAALLLPRGSALREGDLLRADEGDVIVVRAASESLSMASTTDAHTLLRGAYHLGNRHVPVQIGDGWLAYEHDHVLDDMVRGLGLTVEARRAPFEPEGGAFRHEGNGHAHSRGEADHDHHHHHHGGSHRHS